MECRRFVTYFPNDSRTAAPAGFSAGRARLRGLGTKFTRGLQERDFGCRSGAISKLVLQKLKHFVKNPSVWLEAILLKNST
jgi:hypothetical protein